MRGDVRRLDGVIDLLVEALLHEIETDEPRPPAGPQESVRPAPVTSRDAGLGGETHGQPTISTDPDHARAAGAGAGTPGRR